MEMGFPELGFRRPNPQHDYRLIFVIPYGVISPNMWYRHTVMPVTSVLVEVHLCLLYLVYRWRCTYLCYIWDVPSFFCIFKIIICAVLSVVCTFMYSMEILIFCAYTHFRLHRLGFVIMNAYVAWFNPRSSRFFVGGKLGVPSHLPEREQFW